MNPSHAVSSRVGWGIRFTLVVIVLSLAPGLARAFSIIPPADLGQLASQAEAVVLASAGESSAASRGALVFTTTEFHVDDVVAGPIRVGDAVDVVCPGGIADDREWIVDGSPRFVSGERYLLFLDARPGGTWIPKLLSYGLLREAVAGDGRALLTPIATRPGASFRAPNGEIPESIATYERDDLLIHLSHVLSGRDRWTGETLAVEPAVEDLPGIAGDVPAGCTYFVSSNRNTRWRAFDSSGRAEIRVRTPGDGLLTGGGVKEVVQAMNRWMEVDGTGVNLVLEGTTAASVACSGGSNDTLENAIVFNDPCFDIADSEGCGGVLAFGGPLLSGTHSFDGASWATISGWVVVVNNEASCIGSRNFSFMLAHELGHGLGFGHVSDPNALMWEACCNPVNSTDRRCVTYTYPQENPDNERPTVDAGSDLDLALPDRTLRLAGTADDVDGPQPLTTSWAQVSGPGLVTFADPSALSTTATFSRSGVYVLTLTADDGELIRSDAILVSVAIGTGPIHRLTFRQGTDGYTAAIDTILREASPQATAPSGTALTIDGEDTNDLEVHSLLRFGSLFGTSERQVPPGAEVTLATLSVATTDEGSGARFYRMTEPWEERSSWSTFGATGIRRGVHTLSSAEDTIEGHPGAVTIDVTASVAAWSEEPCANLGWALLPIGTNGWTFSSTEGGDRPLLVVEYVAEDDLPLISVGDDWRYLKGRAPPPADWHALDFTPDDEWLIGPTGIGYGDGDDATILSDMEDNYLTVYARREFEVTSAAAVGRLVLDIDYDDGFVAYLNGDEVARSASMGAAGSPVAYNTAASSHDAGAVESFTIGTDSLRDGTNVLAIEVHNSTLGSSDLSLLPSLSAARNFIEPGAEWTFRRGSEAIPVDWTNPAFDDADWERGRAGIGYGDGDDATVLADMEGNYASVFCRKRFFVAPGTAFDEALLSVVYDDGVVVYLNGTEIDRRQMPGGTITRQTTAAASGESNVATWTLPRAEFVEGENVLAVSVHNASLGSSDLSFHAVLVPRDASTAVDCDPESTIRRGDANDDGDLNIADALFTLAYLFEDGPPPECLDAVDANDDGRAEISDALAILLHLFVGRALPPPVGTCAEDPTPDDIRDCVLRQCE